MVRRKQVSVTPKKTPKRAAKEKTGKFSLYFYKLLLQTRKINLNNIMKKVPAAPKKTNTRAKKVVKNPGKFFIIENLHLYYKLKY